MAIGDRPCTLCWSLTTNAIHIGDWVLFYTFFELREFVSSTSEEVDEISGVFPVPIHCRTYSSDSMNCDLGNHRTICDSWYDISREKGRLYPKFLLHRWIDRGNDDVMRLKSAGKLLTV